MAPTVTAATKKRAVKKKLPAPPKSQSYTFGDYTLLDRGVGKGTRSLTCYPENNRFLLYKKLDSAIHAGVSAYQHVAWDSARSNGDAASVLEEFFRLVTVATTTVTTAMSVKKTA